MAAARGGKNQRIRKWTAETVIAGLKEFYASAETLSHTRLPSLEEANPPLIGGARRVFGSLKAAMKAAGLPYPPNPQSPWNEKTILKALRRMHSEGQDLSLAAVKDRHNGSLLGPAMHRFGSWRKAVEAAGIEYSAVKRQQEWTRDSVLQALLQRRDAGEKMGGGAIQKQDIPLWAAAKRYFGHYQDALKAAGIPVAQSAPEWSWSVPQLKRALRDLHKAGVDLSSGRIRNTHKELFCAARIRLGSWRKAVESIGLDYQSIRRANEWSHQAIIDKLRELHSAGADLRPTVIQKEHIPLSGAVQRYFGTLSLALEAAGLPHAEGHSRGLNHWTRSLVVQSLRELHNEGCDLRLRHMKRTHQPLFFAAKELFGLYTNAISEAGIDYWEMSQVQLKREREAKKRSAKEHEASDEP
jgi:hypothetical protein